MPKLTAVDINNEPVEISYDVDENNNITRIETEGKVDKFIIGKLSDDSDEFYFNGFAKDYEIVDTSEEDEPSYTVSKFDIPSNFYNIHPNDEVALLDGMLQGDNDIVITTGKDSNKCTYEISNGKLQHISCNNKLGEEEEKISIYIPKGIPEPSETYDIKHNAPKPSQLDIIMHNPVNTMEEAKKYIPNDGISFQCIVGDVGYHLNQEGCIDVFEKIAKKGAKKDSEEEKAKKDPKKDRKNIKPLDNIPYVEDMARFYVHDANDKSDDDYNYIYLHFKDGKISKIESDQPINNLVLTENFPGFTDDFKAVDYDGKEYRIPKFTIEKGLNSVNKDGKNLLPEGFLSYCEKNSSKETLLNFDEGTNEFKFIGKTLDTVNLYLDDKQIYDENYTHVIQVPEDVPQLAYRCYADCFDKNGKKAHGYYDYRLDIDKEFQSFEEFKNYLDGNTQSGHIKKCKIGEYTYQIDVLGKISAVYLAKGQSFKRPDDMPETSHMGFGVYSLDKDEKQALTWNLGENPDLINFKRDKRYGEISGYVMTYNGVTYTLDSDKKIKAVDFKGKLDTLEIPKGVNGIYKEVDISVDGEPLSRYTHYNVRFQNGTETINEKFFEDNLYIDKIELPASLRHIGVNAFNLCKAEIQGLNKLTNLETIGNNAFYKANFAEKNVDLSNKPKMNEIGNQVFQQSNITGLKLPETIDTVGVGLCYGCEDLENVQFGKNTDAIGKEAFHGCLNLKTTNLSELDKLKQVNDNAFANCKNLGGELKLNGNIEKIGDEAFYGCAFENVSFVKSDNAVSFGKQAFKNTKFKTVQMPYHIGDVGKEAFDSSTLNNIVLPPGADTEKFTEKVSQYSHKPNVIQAKTEDEFINQETFIKAHVQKKIAKEAMNAVEEIYKSEKAESHVGKPKKNSDEYNGFLRALDEYRNTADDKLAKQDLLQYSDDDFKDVRSKMENLRKASVEYLFAKIKQHAKGDYKSSLNNIDKDDYETKQSEVNRYLSSDNAKSSLKSMFFKSEGEARFQMVAKFMQETKTRLHDETYTLDKFGIKELNDSDKPDKKKTSNFKEKISFNKLGERMNQNSSKNDKAAKEFKQAEIKTTQYKKKR